MVLNNKMLRLFQMTRSSGTDNGQSCNEDNKENQGNKDNNNKDEMSEAAASTSPEEQGDDGTTTDTGDPLLQYRYGEIG